MNRHRHSHFKRKEGIHVTSHPPPTPSRRRLIQRRVQITRTITILTPDRGGEDVSLDFTGDVVVELSAGAIFGAADGGGGSAGAEGWEEEGRQRVGDDLESDMCSKLTIRIPSPLSRVGKTPEIQHPTHGQVEKPRRVLHDGQLGHGCRVGGGEGAVGDARVGGREVVVEVTGEPGVDGAGGDEGDVDGEGGGDADFEPAGGAHGVCGVEDFPAPGGDEVSGGGGRKVGEGGGMDLLFGLKTRAMPGPGALQVRKGSEAFQPLQSAAVTVPILSLLSMTGP